MNSRFVRLVVLLMIVPMAWAAASCGKPQKKPRVVIDSPASGDFINAPSVLVQGRVLNIGYAVADLEVNGVSVPVQTDLTWSTTVTLDTVEVFNPISAYLEKVGAPNRNDKKRITVIAGDSVADGSFSDESIAMRLNDSGLDAVEPAITGLVNLDLATLLPAGTLVIDNFCYLDSFLGCIGRVDVTVSGSPPPSIGSFSIDIDSQTNFVEGDVLLNNLFVRANVDDATGVPLSCTIDINAATSDIFGDYTLEPDAVDPSNIDVTQLGLVNLVFGGFSDSTNCSGLLGGLVELLIGLFIGDIQSLVEPAMEDFLNLADGNGNTPIAAAVETALADISITGPIGEGLGAIIDAPLFSVPEDVDGITLASDGRIVSNIGPDPLTQCPPVAEAPDLTASFHIPETFPTFGPTTPGGGLPYGLGLCVSTSAFNQLLKANTECGLLVAQLTELALIPGFPPEPITAGDLSFFIPELAFLPPATLMQITIRPTMSPLITGEDGPSGELAELQVGHLEVALLGLEAPYENQLFLEAAVDFKGGIDLNFDNPTSSLVFALSGITGANLGIEVTQNPINTDEASFVFVMTQILPLLLPDLADSLGSFPLPAFLGLQLQGVETGKNGEFLSLFVDLVPAP